MDQYIHGEVYVPNVVVVATERVRDILGSRFGLSPAQLFSPFGGHYTPISCEVRVLDRVSKISGFKVKFVDVNECVFREGICESLANSRFKQISPALAQTDGFAAWFAGYVEGLSWGRSDCLNQPVCTLLLASSSDPPDIFSQLSHVSFQPSLCKEEVLAGDYPMIKILIEEGLGIPEDKSVYILSLESVSDSQYTTSPLPVPVSHSRVPVTVINRINAVATSIILDGAIPWMESKLTQLDAQVTAKRKGFRNQLKNFLRAVPAETGVLNLHHPEWECRLAGDLAFHLRQHALAFGYYRNIGSDLKVDRFFQAAASCYEFAGLCAVLDKGLDPDPGRFFEVAIELSGGTPPMPPLAIRASVFHAGFALLGRPEAGEKLIKLNSILQNALLLDRAAYMYARAGWHRKEKFTRVLAGHMYNRCDQLKEHALACYAATLDQYPPGWTCISDHLVFTIAKLEFSLNRWTHSVQMLKKLIDNVVHENDTIVTPTMVEKHTNYLKLVAYLGRQGGGVVEGLQLPVIVGPVRWSADAESSESISITLRNPLGVEIVVSGLHVEFFDKSCESEVAGNIVLRSMETREVLLECVGDRGRVEKVKWTVFGLEIEFS